MKRACFGAAAETFEAQRAGAAEQFEHARVEDATAEAVEDRLPHQVGRGADAEALGGVEDQTRAGAADDAHDS